MNIALSINSRPVQAFHSKEHKSLGIIRADGTREFVPFKGEFGKCGAVVIQEIRIDDPAIHDDEDLYPYDCGDLPLKKGTVVYVVSDICYGDKSGCSCGTIETKESFDLTVSTKETRFYPYAKVNLIRLKIEHL